MISVEELAEKIVACRSGNCSIDDFEDWFRTNSRGAYSRADVSEAAASVEAAFSKRYFQNFDDQEFLLELAKAILPFEQRATSMNIVCAVSGHWFAGILASTACRHVRPDARVQAWHGAIGRYAGEPEQIRKPVGNAEIGNPLVRSESATESRLLSAAQG